MTNYKRLYLQNRPVFLTLVTFQRNPILVKNINILRESFKTAKANYNFEIYASVVLPDHIHLILNLENINEYSVIIANIKSYFSRNINNENISLMKEKLTQSNIKKREKGVWQRRFFEHTIRDDEDLCKHMDYIHYNPIKHKYVQNIKNWEYSSFHKFVKEGVYDLNWGNFDRLEYFENLKVNDFD